MDGKDCDFKKKITRLFVEMRSIAESSKRGKEHRLSEIRGNESWHLRKCKECRLYLAYLLALDASLMTTDRVILDENCPDKSDFTFLMDAAYEAIRKIGFKKKAKDFVVIELPYNSNEAVQILMWVLTHIELCGDCANYYERLFANIIKKLKKYNKDIFADKEICFEKETAVKVDIAATFSLHNS